MNSEAPIFIAHSPRAVGLGSYFLGGDAQPLFSPHFSHGGNARKSKHICHCFLLLEDYLQNPPCKFGGNARVSKMEIWCAFGDMYVCRETERERERERESEASSVNMIKYDYGEEEQI